MFCLCRLFLKGDFIYFWKTHLFTVSKHLIDWPSMPICTSLSGTVDVCYDHICKAFWKWIFFLFPASFIHICMSVCLWHSYCVLTPRITNCKITVFACHSNYSWRAHWHFVYSQSVSYSSLLRSMTEPQNFTESEQYTFWTRFHDFQTLLPI